MTGGAVASKNEVRPACFASYARLTTSAANSVVREINKINEIELGLGSSSASWHDDYKGKSRKSI